MKLLTAEQMRAVDRRTVVELGIPGATLMENAGIGVVQILVTRDANERRGLAPTRDAGACTRFSLASHVAQV